MFNCPYAINLKFIYKDSLNNLIIAHLYIKFIRNKFDFLVDKIKGNADIVMAFEDNTFSNGKFLIDSFNGLIRLDKKKNGSKALRCGSFSKKH